MLLCIGPPPLLACTAVAFFTLGTAPGEVNLRRLEVELVAKACFEANLTH